MNRAYLIALMLCMWCSFAVRAEPASPESVEKLLQVTKSESMVGAMSTQLKPMMRQAMQQSVQQQTGGKPLTPEQQEIIDKMTERLSELLSGEFTWEKFKPQLVQIYTESFDQQEVNDLLTFYRTPSGQALIDKMPTVMQKSMGVSQNMLKDFMPKMQQVIRDSMEELKAAK